MAVGEIQLEQKLWFKNYANRISERVDLVFQSSKRQKF